LFDLGKQNRNRYFYSRTIWGKTL